MTQSVPCYHCGEPVPAGISIVARLRGENQAMCCVGCKAVAEFIAASGLSAFYDHRDSPDPQFDLTPQQAQWHHYDSDDLINRYVHDPNDLSEATIDVGGMYCTACVWLFDNALKKLPGIESVSVNPATRRAVIRWDRDGLAFSELLSAIARVGFKPSPLAADQAADARDAEYRHALKRLIVAAAAGMQVMMFAVALYAGDYFGIEGGIERFLRIISLLVTMPIILYSARPFFASAWRGIRAHSPGMDLPVSLAIGGAFIASTYATWANTGDIYFDSVAMFVFFLSATRFLEMRARHRSDDHAVALAELLPDTALRLVDGDSEVVALDRIRTEDVLRIRPGDVIPVDGVVLTGNISIDESMRTGESMAVQRDVGEQVHAGAIVRAGNATVRVTLAGASTSLAEIGRMLDRAKADRPPVAILADRVASRFVTAVLAITTLTAIAWYYLEPTRAFEIALATLVITCPCALALATPAALAAATSRLARSGFLLVRSRVLDVLTRSPIIIFDKTGTLTEGRPQVLKTTRLVDRAPPVSACLEIAAAIETASEHVLARAFSAHYQPGEFTPVDVQVVPGSGVAASVDETLYRIGKQEFAAEGLGAHEMQTPTGHRTDVYLADSKGVLARFEIGDELRADARSAIASLRQRNFRMMIASGDHAAAVAPVAGRLGIQSWRANLTPPDKLTLVHELRQKGETVVMIGDGINDAPVLAAADASVALDAGTALARASADAVSLGRQLGALVTAVDIAADTRQIIRQNIVWAVCYNLTAVPLAVSGLLAPWMAALGMSASSLIVVLNALRLHRSKPHTIAPGGHRETAAASVTT
ncbi:MAG: heavy metal translocating P-type ATPase [Woeseiaceae bacterium]